MSVLLGIGSELPVQIFFDEYLNAAGQGGNGDGQIRVNTAVYSETITIAAGEMPADMTFDFISTLNQTVVCTLQGCNSSNFSTTPVHDLSGAVTLTDGSGTAQTAYRNGPNNFKYYRIHAICGVAPTGGVLKVWYTAFGASLVDGTFSASEGRTVTQATHDNLNGNANIQVGNADVANGNPVPMSDAGGIITVDGTVTAAQTTHDSLCGNANMQVGNADVANGNPVPVSDAGGTLSVDGTVTAAQTTAASLKCEPTQTTHDNLCANANLQIGNADVAAGNPVPLSDNALSLTVDAMPSKTTVAATLMNAVAVNAGATSAVSAVGDLSNFDGAVLHVLVAAPAGSTGKLDVWTYYAQDGTNPSTNDANDYWQVTPTANGNAYRVMPVPDADVVRGVAVKVKNNDGAQNYTVTAVLYGVVSKKVAS